MDVGGSHVTAAVVDPPVLVDLAVAAEGPEVRGTWTERAAEIDPHAPRDVLLDQLTAPARAVAESLAAAATGEGAGIAAARPLRGWAVAMPGPFDYAAGSGTFAGVDKFASLAGVDLRGAFADRLGVSPERVRFCNDAVAYGIGEWAVGAGSRARRMVCLTLGTGVGSSFLDAGVEVDSGPLVPAHGEVHRLTIAGRPLEATMSSPALRSAFRDRSGQEPSVEEICARARAGDPLAVQVLHTALRALGAAVGPWIDRFDADTVVVGGSIARSWDVVGPGFRDGLAAVGASAPVVVPADLGAQAPLVGAAVHWERQTAPR